MQKTSVMLGILLAIFCFMSAVTIDICIKWLSGNYSAAQVIFFRCLFSLFFVIGLMKLKNGSLDIKSYRPHLYIARGAYLLISFFFLVLSLRYITITDFTAISYTTPFFVIALSWLLLNEKVSVHLILATIIGFTGILFIVSPGASAYSLGGLYGLISTVLGAMIIIETKKMSWTESSLTIAFWMGVIGVGASSFFLPFQWITPNLLDIGVFVLLGIANALMQILLAEALKHAPASVISPLDYTTFIWAALFGYLIWGDIPTQMMLFGTAIIILSGLYITYREYLEENPTTKLSFKRLFNKKTKEKLPLS